MTSCDGSCAGDGGGFAETWEKEFVTWCKPAGFALTLQKPEAGGNPPRTYQNPAKPGGTRRNPAEPDGTWRKPGGNPAGNKGKLKMWWLGAWTIGKSLYSQPPPFNLLFFRRVPPGFRQVPPGSSGFRRVPPGSSGFRQVPPGSAGFRWVPALRRVPLRSAGFQVFARSVPPACAKFFRVSANKALAPDSAFNASFHC